MPKKVEEGKYELAMGEYQKGVSEYRARVSENDAEQVRAVGLDEEMQQREKVEQIKSQQRAQLGASGVQIDTGSAAAIQADTETLGEADALRIRKNTATQANVLEDQARFETETGEAELQAAKNRQKSLNRAAIGTVLTGVATSAVTSGLAAKWFTPASSAVTSGFSGSTAGKLPDYLSFTL